MIVIGETGIRFREGQRSGDLLRRLSTYLPACKEMTLYARKNHSLICRGSNGVV
jgi:hypothetical protein